MSQKPTMNIVSKSSALELQRANPAAGPLEKRRFDLGKYKGAPGDYVGREVRAIEGVVAVWPERRTDRDGPYVALMSLSRPFNRVTQS